MDFVPNRERLEGTSNNNSKQKRSSEIRDLFAKVASAVLLLIGISKSFLISFCDFYESNNRHNFVDNSDCSLRDEVCTMNFSALKRRLNPFEKRTKKDAKPKSKVEETESLPTLGAGDKDGPQAVPNNPDIITTTKLLPDPSIPGGFTECTIKADIRNPDRLELTYVDRELGKGDSVGNKPFKSTVIVTKTDKGMVYHGRVDGDKPLERSFTQRFAPCQHDDGPSVCPNSRKTFYEEMQEKFNLNQCKVKISDDEDITMKDVLDQMKDLSLDHNKPSTSLPEAMKTPTFDFRKETTGQIKIQPFPSSSAEGGSSPSKMPTKARSLNKDKSRSSISSRASNIKHWSATQDQQGMDTSQELPGSNSSTVKDSPISQPTFNYFHAGKDSGTPSNENKATHVKYVPAKQPIPAGYFKQETAKYANSSQPNASRQPTAASRQQTATASHINVDRQPAATSRQGTANNTTTSQPNADRQPTASRNSPTIPPNQGNAAETGNQHDIVSAAFQHAIIPEAVQTAGCGLARGIRLCFETALKKERENSKVTDPIDNISPVLDSIEKREKKKDGKPLAKKKLRVIAKEAAYIKHECDKIQYNISALGTIAAMVSSDAPIEFYEDRAVRIRERFSQLILFLRRLCAYEENQAKLPCLAVYREPVFDDFNSTLTSVRLWIQKLQTISENTQNQLRILKENAEQKRQEQERLAKAQAQTTAAAQTNTTTGTGTQTVDVSSAQASQCAQGHEESSPAQPQVVTRHSYKTARQKYWSPNKASELRCAQQQQQQQQPDVNGLGGRRIITPIKKLVVTKPDPGPEIKVGKSVLDNPVTENVAKETNASPRPSCPPPSRTPAERERVAAAQQACVHNGPSNKTAQKTSEAKHVLPSVISGIKKGREPISTSGGGDGQTEAPNSRGLNITSTPKKGPTCANAPATVEKTPGAQTRRQLLSDENTHKPPSTADITSEFTDEDTEIVRSFCDGGTDCLDKVDLDSNMVGAGEKNPTQPTNHENQNGGAPKTEEESAQVFQQQRGGAKQFKGGTSSQNNTFNQSMDSSMTGNDSRNMSDTSYTSFIETNNTLDFSSLEVKPGHGRGVNKKKLEAEIKPKKKKTRGTPNQHLDGKPGTPNSKGRVDSRSRGDSPAENSFKAGKDGSFTNSPSFRHDKRRKDAQTVGNGNKDGGDNESESVAKRKILFEPKPMHYKDCRQTIDQRELNMVPDHVHYRNESKLKEVEDMYTVSSGKGKKKKKRKEKKVKGGKQKDDDKLSDGEDWFLD